MVRKRGSKGNTAVHMYRLLTERLLSSLSAVWYSLGSWCLSAFGAPHQSQSAGTKIDHLYKGFKLWSLALQSHDAVLINMLLLWADNSGQAVLSRHNDRLLWTDCY